MTELVGRLQPEGLVTRFSDLQDGRATLVEITARGRAHRVKLQNSKHDRLMELLEALPAEDQATLSLAMRVAAPRISYLMGFPRNRGGFLYAASGWMAAIFSYSTGGSNPAELWRRRVL